jgi:hypothetical protein
MLFENGLFYQEPDIGLYPDSNARVTGITPCYIDTLVHYFYICNQIFPF